MYLQNVARQYRRNLVVADMVVLQVDRRLDIPLAAKDEDFRLDAAREVGIEAQNLGIQQLPGDDILRQVYFGDFVFRYHFFTALSLISFQSWCLEFSCKFTIQN